MPALLAVAFIDELWSGVPVVDAPAIEAEHGLTHGTTALVLLTFPQIIASVVEARLLLWAHGRDPRRWIVGSLFVLAATAVLAAFATAPWMLALAMGIAGPASGCACALAQGALVESRPDARERVMASWTLAGGLGDLAAPVLVAIVGAAGLGWRTALFVVAVIVLAHALVVARVHVPAIDSDDDDEHDDDGPTDWRSTLKNRTLVLWLAGTTACALLDEILVALAALHLRRDLHADEATTAFALAGWAFFGSIALYVTERLLRRVSARRLLVGATIACTIACASWIWIDDPVIAAIALIVIGVTSAPQYPIAKAQAYRACPGRPALIGAVSQVFAPVEIALPWLLGLLADRAGLHVALAALMLEPLVLLVLAAIAWPRRATRAPT